MPIGTHVQELIANRTTRSTFLRNVRTVQGVSEQSAGHLEDVVEALSSIRTNNQVWGIIMRHSNNTGLEDIFARIQVRPIFRYLSANGHYPAYRSHAVEEYRWDTVDLVDEIRLSLERDRVMEDGTRRLLNQQLTELRSLVHIVRDVYDYVWLRYDL